MKWFLNYRKDLAQLITYCEVCPFTANRMLAIPTRERLQRALRYMLDENEFLSPHGLRSVSRVHREKPYIFHAGNEEHRVDYVPGEGTSYLFGGNSNWRGPIWFLIKAKQSTETAKARRPKYVARLAQTAEEVRRAQRLRFEVFNLELNEGLVESHFTGLDVDPFDNVCDHLIVEDVATDEIVGTYRLQTGARAAANLGYYSEREFDFTPYEPLRGEMIDLGRACVHADHRTFNLLHLLWRGLAVYV